jgi:hypothetical protein
MSSKQIRLSLRAVPLLIGLGAAGLAMGAGTANSSDEPLRCEIQADSSNGMITLQGVIHSDVPLSGSYRFKVASAGGAGNTNMSQGGGFTAAPGETVMLGKVMLGNAGAIYDATLEVESDGMAVECEERVGGAI